MLDCRPHETSNCYIPHIRESYTRKQAGLMRRMTRYKRSGGVRDGGHQTQQMSHKHNHKQGRSRHNSRLKSNGCREVSAITLNMLCQRNEYQFSDFTPQTSIERHLPQSPLSAEEPIVYSSSGLSSSSSSPHTTYTYLLALMRCAACAQAPNTKDDIYLRRSSHCSTAQHTVH